MKRIFSTLVAAVFSVTLFAEPLRICPACGREDLKGVEKCPFCGAQLPPLVSSKPQAPVEQEKSPDLHAGAFEEASKDVIEARKCCAEKPAVAIALYENALALLAADLGDDFNVKAARQIQKELVKCRERVKAAVGGSFLAHQKIMSEGRRDAVVFFKAQGRVPFGRVWVPSDWPSRLPPPNLAAVRHGLQPVCKACNGLGAVPCKKCKGTGRIPCDNPGCKQGWIYSKSANSLGGTGKRASSALTTRSRCPVCNGTAFRPCTECQGTGRTICGKCGGNGEAPICAACQGTGLLPCKKCARAIEKGERDKPFPNCLECRGSGEVLCRKCGGDGRIRK